MKQPVTKTLRDYILNECKMDSVGFAPASALEDEPPKQRPTDVLPGAKSMIVFTCRIPDGAVQSAFRAKEDGVQDAYSSYAAYGNELTPNMLLFFMQFNIAEFIERSFGFTAVPIPSGPMQNVTSTNTPLPAMVGAKRLAGVINPERAAVAAGLGEIGWNNQLVTPENGPRQRIGIVLSTLPLDYDEPYNGPRLCNPEECGVCAKICPTGAIPQPGGECDIIEVAGKVCRVARLDANACAVASMAFRREFSGKSKVPDLIMTDHPTDAELAEAYAKKPINHCSLDHYPKYYCDKCMLYCPLGNWDKRFRDKGLSKFERGDLNK